MKDTEQSYFFQLLTLYGETYRHRISESYAKNLWQHFRDYDFNQVRDAYLKHSKDLHQGKFYPTPSHILNHLQGNKLKKESDLNERIELSWIEVKKALKNYGDKSLRELRDKQAAVTIVELGGWKQLSGCTNHELLTIKREFASIYRTLNDLTPLNLLERLPKKDAEQPEPNRSMSPAEQLATCQGIIKEHFRDA